MEFFSFCAGSATLNDFVPARAEPQPCAISIHQREGQEAGALWSLLLFYMSKDKPVQAAKINKGSGPAHSLHSHQKKMPSLPSNDFLYCFLEKKKKKQTKGCNTSSFPDWDSVRIIISSTKKYSTKSLDDRCYVFTVLHNSTALQIPYQFS